MNANELADELFKEKIGICHVAATMLRQKQAEIDSLKANLSEAKNVIESIVWKDRKPFDDGGWASVSFDALAKGAEFLGKAQYK